MTAVKTDRVCPTASPGQAMGHCVARSGSLYIDTSSAYGQQPDNPDTLLVTGYAGQRRYSMLPLWVTLAGAFLWLEQNIS